MRNLLDSLTPDTCVVTANRRLARGLRAAHDQGQLAAGRAAWPSADILPLTAFIQRCWSEAAGRASETLPILLNPLQEQALWDGIVARGVRDFPGHELLHAAATAGNARLAWHRLRAWQVELGADADFLNQDALAFRAWSESYRRRLESEGWIDAAQLPDALRSRLRAGAANPPRRILLAGFDALAPQHEALLDDLAGAGAEVAMVPPPALGGSARRIACADTEAELHAAALWARRCLERSEPGPIGIVVPNLGSVRRHVERIFGEVLHPDRLLGDDAGRGACFNISLGEPLARYAVVADALLALECTQGQPSLQHIGRLLRSSYFTGGCEEHAARATLDARLRRLGEPGMDLASLARALHGGAGPPATSPCGRSAAAMERFLALVESAPRRARPSRWAEWFRRWLDAAGWPGERALDSSEYQCVEAFREALGTLPSMDAVTGDTAPGRVIAWLRRQASERILQAGAEDTPVQILGLLESGGLPFERLWVAGLQDEAWPAPPQPNPLLPAALQRRLGMPRSSSDWELEYARRHTVRLLGSAPDVVLSYPERHGEQRMRPSRLISGLPPTTPEALGISGHTGYAEALRAAAPGLDRVADARAPALAADAPACGGTSLLRDQAACPFRAAARHRFGAEGIEIPAHPFDARLRGIMLHRVLERVWGAVQSHACLVAMSEDQRRACVVSAVASTLNEQQALHPLTLRERFRALETARLERLVSRWLDLEAARRPFRVLRPEQGRRARISGLAITFRPDRVDVIDGAGPAIIDYKTGGGSLGGWFGERPDEPQLPFYVVALEDDAGGGREVCAAAFGVVRRGGICFRGLGAGDGLLPGVTAPASPGTRAVGAAADWRDLKRRWRAVLGDLAAAFVRGEARVDPKDPRVTCRQCDLHAFCRVHERLEPSPWSDAQRP